MELLYKIKNQDSFELKDIFECGQCFRWNSSEDGSYTGVIKNAVLNVSKIDNEIIFKGIFINDNSSNMQIEFENLIRDYFDLDNNYNVIKQKLSNIDEFLKESVEFGKRN